MYKFAHGERFRFKNDFWYDECHLIHTKGAVGKIDREGYERGFVIRFPDDSPIEYSNGDRYTGETSDTNGGRTKIYSLWVEEKEDDRVFRQLTPLKKRIIVFPHTGRSEG